LINYDASYIKKDGKMEKTRKAEYSHSREDRTTGQEGGKQRKAERRKGVKRKNLRLRRIHRTRTYSNISDLIKIGWNCLQHME
jgi:hypothetical protein